IYRDVDPRTPLQPSTAQGINRTHYSSGTPTEYAIVDGKLILNPSPDGSENIKLRYFAKLADLSADGDENDILTKYPGIYIYGALTHHANLIRDTNAAATWGQVYRSEMNRARGMDQSDRHSGAPLVPSVRVAP
ncbi:MAG: phage adaptor protein, partial [Paracoccaceae bacterium]